MHCIQCRLPWSRDFATVNMTKQFMTHDYRDLKERIAFDRERSLLPTALPFVHEVRIQQEEIVKLEKMKRDQVFLISEVERTHAAYKEHQDVLSKEKGGRDAFSNYKKTWDAYSAAEKMKKKHNVNIRQSETKIRNISFMINQITPVFIEDGTKKKGFITRGHCPKTNCNGFVEERWSCVVCKTKVCETCHDVTTDGHICAEETVASLRLIRSECKPCPSCRVRVFRVEGCSQMWCTNCDSAFDWKTGLSITTEYFHNPHYADWVARNVAKKATVDNDDFVYDCQVPMVNHWRINNVNDTDEAQVALGAILNCANALLDIRYYDPLTSNEEVCRRKVRIAFLMGGIEEGQFKRDMQRIDKRFMKKREIDEVFVMFATVCREILWQYIKRELNAIEVQMSIDNEVRPFALASIEKIASIHGSVQINTLKQKLQPTYICGRL